MNIEAYIEIIELILDVFEKISWPLLAIIITTYIIRGGNTVYKVIDSHNNHLPIKGGFKTAAAANNWCKKNLPLEEVHLWGCKPPKSLCRYYIMMDR